MLADALSRGDLNKNKRCGEGKGVQLKKDLKWLSAKLSTGKAKARAHKLQNAHIAPMKCRAFLWSVRAALGELPLCQLSYNNTAQ